MSGTLNLPYQIQQAFATLAAMGLTDSVTYTPGGTTTYNPSTGAVTNTAATLSFNAAFTRFGETELDSSIIISTDAKMLVAGSDLAVTPSNTDTLVAKGIKWKVIKTLGVPTNGFWKIHVRRV